MGMIDSKEEQNHPAEKSFWREAGEVLKVFLVSLAIVLPIRYFIVQPFIVRGASMEPNFEDREYLIIDEASYYFRTPQRGEVVVFRYPRDPRQFFIKRIIGLPGEGIEIRNGRVNIKNIEYPEGFVLEEPYLAPPGRLTHPNVTIALGDDEYFVMGDNRDFSSDSRIWGPLEKHFIVGRTMFRVWPFADLGFVPDFTGSAPQSL